MAKTLKEITREERLAELKSALSLAEAEVVEHSARRAEAEKACRGAKKRVTELKEEMLKVAMK